MGHLKDSHLEIHWEHQKDWHWAQKKDQQREIRWDQMWETHLDLSLGIH